jgi:hypothetical protein
LHHPVVFAADLYGQWSGAYELRNARNELRYDDLFVTLRLQAGTLTGSAGPHEYEQYQISDAHIEGPTIGFEVYRGRLGTTSFTLTLVGARLTGTAKIDRESGTQLARVILDRVPVQTQRSQPSRVDLSVIEKIKAESLNNSQVMGHAFYLTDMYGPRLTGSRNFRLAGDWVASRLRDLGVENVVQEPIPNPYPGWQQNNFTIRLLEPENATLSGVPLTWSAGTDGPVTGEAVYFVPTERDARNPGQFFDRFRGKLKGKFLLIDAWQAPRLPATPLTVRLTEEELANLAQTPQPIPVPSRPTATGQATAGSLPNSPVELSTSWLNQPRGFVADVFQFINDEGAIALVQEGTRLNNSGIIRAMGVRQGLPPSFVMAAEHYDRIARLLEHGVPVRLEMNLTVEFNESGPNSFNVIGEIPGARKKDEIVMLGAHLDSWTGGTGATDNAAGCAVVLEALRILKKLDLKMDRTIRAAFWGAEETGPIGGSSAYVKEHFADLNARKTKPEYSKFSVYFNMDSGTGKVRGVYLEGFEGARASLESWLQPFKELGATMVGRRISFGSDHAPFVRTGLPAIYLEQDPLDFETRTNHTNMDVYDRLQSGDLKQAAAVLAALVYDAAVSEDPIPRKPLLPFQLRP